MYLGLPESGQREVALPAEEQKRYVGSYDVGLRGWYVQVAEREAVCGSSCPDRR